MRGEQAERRRAQRQSNAFDHSAPPNAAHLVPPFNSSLPRVCPRWRYPTLLRWAQHKCIVTEPDWRQ
jgi:hypothetical protein